MEFDGTSNYLEIPDSDDWYFGANDFTIEFWVQCDLSYSNNTIMGQNAGLIPWWFIFVDAHFDSYKFSYKLRFRSFFGDYPYTTFYIEIPWELSVDTWYHLAFVRSGNDWFIFTDGVSQPLTWHNGDAESAVFHNAPKVLNMGGDFYGPVSWGLRGSLDEVRFWDEAMTEEEVNAWMYSNADGTEEHLKACWNFDEGSGDTVHDLTDNNNDGTIHGSPQWVLSTALQKRRFLQGDLDLSGVLDSGDHNKIMANFGNRNITSYLQGDITGDGRVDLSDFALLKSNYGSDNRVEGGITDFYEGNDLIVQLYPDAHRAVYVYQDCRGLFTLQELLDAFILQEGDIIIEVLADDAENRYDHLGDLIPAAPIAGAPDAVAILEARQTAQASAGKRNRGKLRFYRELKGKRAKYLD